METNDQKMTDMVLAMDARIKELEAAAPEPDKLQQAFDLGQQYQYHADHEFYSYNKKADAIMEKFRALRNAGGGDE